jgi:glycosyltransferase involved in cell wall biosynthesis
MTEKKYSLCITNYNTVKTLSSSLNSVFEQVDDSFEIVISDSCSNDGSLEILKDMRDSGKIKLLIQKSTRGVGRQIAFEESKGEYIIQIDSDDVLKPSSVRDLTNFYHKNFNGFLMLVIGLSIAPRGLIATLGGWRDLQWGEDRDLWARAAEAGKFVYVPYEARSSVTPFRSRKLIKRIRYLYERARDSYRVGLKPYENDAKLSSNYLSSLAISALGYLGSRFAGRYPPSALGWFQPEKYVPTGLRLDATGKCEKLVLGLQK